MNSTPMVICEPAEIHPSPASQVPADRNVRPRPPLFRALGAADPPPEVSIEGRCYAREEILKHDSWAATAIYRGPAGKIVCKFNRQQSIFGLPMRWLGRVLARREAAMLRNLEITGQVPKLSGPVTAGGRLLEYAVAHAYVPGHPLSRNEVVDDRFFPSLQALLDRMHAGQMAYVDLHKRENVIVGDDGRPYLIDFQISLMLPEGRLSRLALLRTLLRFFQLSDNYHLLKHWAAMRPDQCGVTTKDIDHLRPWWIRVHRLFAVPFRQLRRRLLASLHIRSAAGEARSEQFAEHAIREEERLRRPAA
jgi:hypothetical protein